MTNITGYQSILDFWFGEFGTDIETLERQSPLWWSKNDSVDREIEKRFGFSLSRLVDGQLDTWKNLPGSYLAMIILADQFSRNIYRDSDKAFAQDSLALELCLQGINAGIDLKLGLVQRLFFYLPLEHSESMSLQDRSVEVYRQLCEAASGDVQNKLRGNLEYAIKHHEVIEKFGRFPHRNKILGRVSTAEEIEFLQQPGSHF